MTTPSGYVLIVDDVAVFRQVLCRAIQLDGHEALVASTGVEALALIRRSPPRLILLDLVMPGMDGWELLRTVRVDPALTMIPIIILSATTDDDVAARALAQGATMVLFKTEFSIRELRQTIKDLMREPPSASK